MPVVIESAPVVVDAEVSAAPPLEAPEVAPLQKLKIAGRERDVRSITVGGKTVIYTETLTVSERMKLSTAMPTEFTTAPEAYGFSQVAARVRMVDGVPLAFPETRANIEANLERIGDEIAETLFDQASIDYAKRREERAKNFSATADGG